MANTPKKRKKTKKQRPVIDYVFYIFVRVIALFIQMSDVNTSLRTARFLGRCMYFVYRRGRLRAMENLRLSYPEKSTAWLKYTTRRSFEHIVMLAFDVLYTTRLVRLSTWTKYMVFDNISEPLKHMLKKRGVIMVTGHYGNFEVLGYALAVFGLESYSIARPIDNPYINKFLLGVRERQGQIIIDKKGATNMMLRILESGSMLSFIADQNAGRKGIFVDFFGRKASTYKSIGLLAMQYDLPITIGYARRLNDQYRFEIGCHHIITPEDWKQQDDPLHWITAEYTKGIENFVRANPEQYWWVHRRWKTRPPEERT